MYTIYADDTLLYLPGDEELSVLSPVLETSCNAAGTLTFVLLPSHPLYDKLQKLKTRIRVMQDESVLWRGRVLETESDFYRQKTVTCEGELTYLVDSVQHPYQHDGTAADLFRLYLTAHNAAVEESQQFQAGNIDITTLSSVENTGYGNTWDEISSNLIDIHGGFLRIRYDGGTRYLDWTKDSGESCAQTIEFGRNLLDLTEYISAAEVVTCLIPTTGQSGSSITIESVNGGKDFIEDEEAVKRYGRVWGVAEFDAKTAEDLLTMAKEYLQKKLREAVTITISAVDLHLLDVTTDAFRVGDKVRVISAPHGMDAAYTCTAISLDLVNPDQSQYTFGTPETGMASTTAATSKAVELVDSSVEYLRQIVSDQNTHLLITDGLITAYTQKTNENTDTLNTVQTTLDSVSGTLSSYVTATNQNTQDIATVKTTLDGIGSLTAYAERLDKAENEITRVQATLDSVSGTLETKVSKGDVVSTINQSAGAVKISAACIDLDGYVTADALSAMKADVSWLNGVALSVAELTARSGAHLGVADATSMSVSDALSANTISANAIGATLALSVGGSAASWQKQTVVTAINDALRVSKTSQTITYATPEGGENTINVLTNVQVFAGGRYSTKEISYLGAGASE